MGTEEITLGVMACIVPALWRQGQEDPYLSSSSRSLRVCFLKIHNKGEWFMRNVHCPWPSYMPADMHYTDMLYTDTHYKTCITQTCITRTRIAQTHMPTYPHPLTHAQKKGRKGGGKQELIEESVCYWLLTLFYPQFPFCPPDLFTIPNISQRL